MAKKRRSSQFKDTSQVIDIEEARRKRQEKRQKQQRRERKREEMPEKRTVRASVKAGRRKKHITYAVIILAIIAAIGVSILNIISLKAEYREVEQQQQQLIQEKEALEQQLKDSSKDKYIEKEARQQLRMVKPGETVFIVPNQGQEEQAPASDKENEKE